MPSVYNPRSSVRNFSKSGAQLIWNHARQAVQIYGELLFLACLPSSAIASSTSVSSLSSPLSLRVRVWWWWLWCAAAVAMACACSSGGGPRRGGRSGVHGSSGNGCERWAPRRGRARWRAAGVVAASVWRRARLEVEDNPTCGADLTAWGREGERAPGVLGLLGQEGVENNYK